MEYFLKEFPGENELLEQYDPGFWKESPRVNNHIHTPYSFSAFNSVEEAVSMAQDEQLGFLGINDFNVCDGYEAFIRACCDRRIFPLLNIELIGISRKEQEEGVRINDPKNPGRTYISGKGLAFPSILPEEQQQKLDRVVEESNRQVGEMIQRLNAWLEEQDAGFVLSAEQLKSELAVNLLRERHVAKALRLEVEKLADGEGRRKLLKAIYGGKESEKDPFDVAGMEDELRSRLLKAGAPAFVPEDPRAFLPLEEIVQLIEDAGGIPTYPVLMDGAGGSITEFEDGKEQLLKRLEEWGFRSIEFIPLRNRHALLMDYVEYFYEKGFTISFGTEHNTSAMIPLTVSCLGQEALGERLSEISFLGAVFQVAHQYLVAKEGNAYRARQRHEMEELGKAILQFFQNRS